jgi:hypothetical protein
VAVLVANAVFGGLGAKRLWPWGIAVGIWLPLFEIAFTRDFDAVLAIMFAFAGAYAGMGARKALNRANAASLSR